jgi:hypothetical protein
MSDRRCELCERRRARVHLKVWVLKAHPPFLVDTWLCRACRERAPGPDKTTRAMIVALRVINKRMLDLELAQAIAHLDGGDEGDGE